MSSTYASGYRLTFSLGLGLVFFLFFMFHVFFMSNEQPAPDEWASEQDLTVNVLINTEQVISKTKFSTQNTEPALTSWQPN